MDTTRFDHLARTLAAMRTRRAAVGVLAGVTLGGAALPRAGAVKHRCGPCQRKKRGKCRGQKPDGTRCGPDRECCRGSCESACAPTELRDAETCGCCLRNGQPCLPGPEACCSGLCAGDIGDPVGVCAAPAGAVSP